MFICTFAGVTVSSTGLCPARAFVLNAEPSVGWERAHILADVLERGGFAFGSSGGEV